MNKEYQPHTLEEQKAFDTAIDKVLEYVYEESTKYHNMTKEFKPGSREYLEFHYKALALLDFKLYLQQLFKEYIFISD